MDSKKWYVQGLRDGVPIFLGYLAVAFTVGIFARNAGLTSLQASLMSFLNNTSAGQFVAIGLIASSSGYLELAAVQLVVNLRYLLMSCSLSQKIQPKAPFFHRLLLGYNVTDEVFALLSAVDGYLTPAYTYGLSTMSIPGWTLGTFLGCTIGGILSERLLSAMGVALYGMFISVIVPPAKKDRRLLAAIAVSMAISAGFPLLPGLKNIPQGFKIIILAVLISALFAAIYPVPKGEGEEGESAA